jgi:6-bladed beta-propeller
VFSSFRRSSGKRRVPCVDRGKPIILLCAHFLCVRCRGHFLRRGLAGIFFFNLLLLPSFAASEKTIEVHNKLPKGGDKALFQTTMRLEKDLEIGRDEAENLPVLARVSDIVVDSRGRIYVAEADQNFVLLYDDRGSFIRQIGREGEGPGEFRRPEALALNARNELFVADQQCVSMFDSTHTFITRFNHQLHDGTIRGMVVNGASDIFLSSFQIFGQKVIHKFSRDGTRLLSFCDSYAVGEGEDFRVEQVYAGGPIDMDPQGRVCYSQLTPYEIRKFSDHGSTLMLIERENAFMLKAEVRRIGKDTMQFAMPTGSYGFCVLSDGTMVNSILVAKAQEEEGTPGSFIDVFKADGKLLGSIAIEPSSLLLGRDTVDRLYFLQYSEPIAVVRYRLKR